MNSMGSCQTANVLKLYSSLDSELDEAKSVSDFWVVYEDIYDLCVLGEGLRLHILWKFLIRYGIREKIMTIIIAMRVYCKT